MKNIKSLLIIIFAGTFLAGCVSDEGPDAGPVKNVKTVTFTLPGTSNGAKTYAIDSEDGEDKLDNLDIYMFDENIGTLEKIFYSGDISLSSEAGPAQTATIDVTECEGAKVFFFIGNGNGITSEVGKARYGETTITEFQEYICDKQTALPVTPLLMTGKGRINDIETPLPTELEISLTRRVARFDVRNTTATTNFKVTKILIGNVNLQTHIFGEALGTGSPVMATGNIPEIAFGTQTNANAGDTPSVFYTYPTVIGTGKTEITIVGEFKTEERAYAIKSQTDINIEANKRYILKVEPISINEVEVTLTVAEWGDGSVVPPAEPESNLIAYSDLALTSGDGALSGTKLDGTAVYDVTGATASGVIELSITALRSSGAEIMVTYLKGDASIVPITYTKTTPVVTYAGARYLQEFKVMIGTPAAGTVSSVDAVVEVYNVYDPIQTESFRVVRDLANYPGMNHKPVKFGGIWWAPCNTGASNVGGTSTSQADLGFFHQWGRNYGAPYGKTGDIVAGPFSVALANQAANVSKFITSTVSDWADPSDNSLWNGNNVQGPCPAGWRLPTQDDMQKIVNAWNKKDGSVVFDSELLKIKGDEQGETLYLQSDGYIRHANNGTFTRVNHTAYYTSSVVTPDRGTVLRIEFDESDMSVQGDFHRAFGRHVRCVKNK